MDQQPSYRIPPVLFARIGLSWLWQRPRDFQADARACIASLGPAPQVSGRENIPQAGACLVTFNHYNRPGCNVMWLVMALAAALPSDLMSRASAVMTGEFTYPGKWYGSLGRPLSRLLLKRLARLYGFMRMPPMPPRAGDVTERARSVRAVLAWLEQTREPVLLLAPEGSDQAGGILSRPPAGVGRFIALMAARGLRILPAAGWEQDGALRLSFGPLYTLNLPDGLARAELDQAASSMVMRAIAALLPGPLRGEFHE